MQAGTTPKKRTSLNGRAALKLMRLDGARRADQAASDARVTKASSSIAVALLLISSGASATECQSSPGHDGKWWSYRIVDSKRCWYQGRPGRSKDLLHWAKQSPPPVVTRPDPGDSPPPAPPVPPQQPTEIVDTTPKVVSTVSIPVLTSEAPQMAAPPPSLPEPPPLPAKPTKPSKWWMLLLIIPAIATGLAVVASQFQPARWTLFKNFRRRWTNWQARLAGHLDLMGDNITQWSRRASRPVQIDPTSPSSERPSPSNRPSSSLTTFDPKSLESRELAEMNERLMAGRRGIRHFGKCQKGTSGLYSTTSSARPIRDAGRVTPRVFAVLRFTANSKRIGCCTGSSLGLVPLRILATYPADRRYISGKLGP